MINIALCDDDIPFTGEMDTYLNKIGKENYIDMDLEVFWDGKDLADMVEAGKRYDLIFLDVEMKMEDGLTAAKRIREIDKMVLIIYVSSHETYMRDSFEVRPFRFLVKPVKIEMFKRCFMEAYNEIIDGNYYFHYRYNRVNYSIPVQDICYFKSKGRKIYIVMNSGIQETYGKLDEVEKKMKKGKIPFFRIHQSYLVNYKKIQGQAFDHVVMSDGKRISISEDRRKEISERYCQIGDIIF